MLHSELTHRRGRSGSADSWVDMRITDDTRSQDDRTDDFAPTARMMLLAPIGHRLRKLRFQMIDYIVRMSHILMAGGIEGCGNICANVFPFEPTSRVLM